MNIQELMNLTHPALLRENRLYSAAPRQGISDGKRRHHLHKRSGQEKGLDIQNARVVVQGFGNAGSYLAKFMHDAGAKVVGISDAYGGLYDPDGLDIDYLLDRRDSFGTVTKLFNDTITNQELLELDCDILVPAAIENQITEENADRIKAKIVVEAANGPNDTGRNENPDRQRNAAGSRCSGERRRCNGFLF